MQQYADIYLLHSHSTCFGYHSKLLSTVNKQTQGQFTLANFNLYFTLLPIPEVAVTFFSTPDDGCCDARNM